MPDLELAMGAQVLKREGMEKNYLQSLEAIGKSYLVLDPGIGLHLAPPGGMQSIPVEE